MYSERSQYRRYVSRLWRDDDSEARRKGQEADRSENNRHGQELALARISEFITLKLAHVGMAGEENIGYRKAMRDVTGEILRQLREMQT